MIELAGVVNQWEGSRASRCGEDAGCMGYRT